MVADAAHGRLLIGVAGTHGKSTTSGWLVHALVGLGADPARVILMPEGVDREILRERSVWLAEVCKREGFRFSPRLHVELYGNRRGV